MSIEVVLHPKSATRDELARLLRELGYSSCSHLWDWPKGSLNFHWFEMKEYLSYDGVEATVFKPAPSEKGSATCDWFLHTRTRSSASPADKNKQDATIRAARARFGGDFYNDWHGKNRYTNRQPDGRDAAARGIYLAYEATRNHLSAVQYSIPSPTVQLSDISEKGLELLANIDPVRVLYNALVPFALASLEGFFSQSFKVLLRYDPKAQAKLVQQSRKVEFQDVIAIRDGRMTIEDVIADSYSFQNISHIHKAFSEWFGIDFRSTLRARKKMGSKIALLEDRLNYIIAFRHGVIHRMEIDRSLTHTQIDDIFLATRAIIDTFVDHIEKRRGVPIRN